MSTARIRVRQAVAGDEPVLRSLRLEALAHAPEAFTSTLAREAFGDEYRPSRRRVRRWF
ncbi:MAG TPA: hypothetical protein VF200_15490 [Woeseiaceae bacterium]